MGENESKDQELSRRAMIGTVGALAVGGALTAGLATSEANAVPNPNKPDKEDKKHIVGRLINHEIKDYSGTYANKDVSVTLGDPIWDHKGTGREAWLFDGDLAYVNDPQKAHYEDVGKHKGKDIDHDKKPSSFRLGEVNRFANDLGLFNDEQHLFYFAMREKLKWQCQHCLCELLVFIQPDPTKTPPTWKEIKEKAIEIGPFTDVELDACLAHKVKTDSDLEVMVEHGGY